MNWPRPYRGLSNEEIAQRIESDHGRKKPWVYMDAIDSILNIRPDIELVVADGRSTESMRTQMLKHHQESNANYTLLCYPDKMSQWIIFNDVIDRYVKSDTKYFVYTSSDIIWQMDWVEEAIKEFDKNPKLQILFPCVNNGDGNLPCQVASGPRDLDPIKPPYQEEAKAPVLNAYAMIFRMDFLRAFGGYPTVFRNCYSESFLHYMCLAVGGEQRLLPRGWCHHYGTVDIWQENGSFYYFNEEGMQFQEIMNKVQMAHGMGLLTVDFLKNILYKKRTSHDGITERAGERSCA